MGVAASRTTAAIEIVLRPIPHSADEVKLGHCYFYPQVATDAISCTFNMDGYSPMKAVLRAHGLDEGHFQKCHQFHEAGLFRVITHGDEFPNIITVTKTQTWNAVPNATFLVLRTVEDQHCKSLCMTHFGYILGRFPCDAFTSCMRAVNLAWTYSKLKKIVVDVDERYFPEATCAWHRLLTECRA